MTQDCNSQLVSPLPSGGAAGGRGGCPQAAAALETGPALRRSGSLEHPLPGPPPSGGGKSVLFSGHMDVVPPYPLPWSLHEPYDTALEGEKLFGRGTVDMKGGLLAAFLAIRFLKQSGFCPKGDILFESVVDEEYAGANGTLAGRVRGDQADFAIIPEGTGMKICPICFGAKLIKIAIHGLLHFVSAGRYGRSVVSLHYLAQQLKEV